MNSYQKLKAKNKELTDEIVTIVENKDLQKIAMINYKWKLILKL